MEKYNKVNDQEIREYLQKIAEGKIEYKYLLGAFGITGKKEDSGKATAIVQEEIFPEEGGSYLRILGCAYFLKGCPFGMIPGFYLELLGVAKSMFSDIFLMVMRSRFMQSYVLLLYIINKKLFYNILNEYVGLIYDKSVNIVKFPQKRYNKYATEMMRAFNTALEKEYKPKKPFTEYWIEDSNENKKLKLLVPLAKMFNFAVYVLEFDSAYRWQLQDGLSELNKKNDPIKELNRICDIIIERYQNDDVREKYLAIKKITKILKFSPMFRRILKNFFDELDIEKIKLDEHDLYYCLNRADYNFKGIPLEDRIKEKERLDKKMGNIKINFKLVNKDEFEKMDAKGK
ncbi:hypothetical protein [Methanoculleus sp.]|jgi:hypothetical protein|uniref:hypothetical protein n=1 Tax=Methanoculleus sp. TaxID=90427 RepID=UPI0025DE7252|nr:hypothetical protein [Methanoculleus sp.]MCK9319537.1 hypothetical protein [Methanoculleus sp.]